ncbi:MAG: hypothetical protein KAH11_02245 [Rhodospirillales bacterium]|nr:hypothetical protein [Rhodospirillales bacterium]
MMRVHVRRLALAVMVIASLPPVTASGVHAADPPFVRIDAVAALARVPANADRISAALVIDLAPGWKTYWRSPGPFGMPLTITPAASSSVLRADILWPAPTRFVHERTPALSTIGYAGRTVIPLELHLKGTARDILFDADISLGICRDACIPHTAAVSLELPRGAELKSPHAAIVEFARKALPHRNDAPEAPTHIAWAAMSGDGADILIGICTDGGQTDDTDIFIAALDDASFATPPEVDRAHGNTVVYRTYIDPDFATGARPAGPAIGTRLDITFKEEHGAVTALVPLRERPPDTDTCPKR